MQGRRKLMRRSLPRKRLGDQGNDSCHGGRRRAVASSPRFISVPRHSMSKPSAPASSAICCEVKPPARAMFCCCAICFPPIRRWSKDSSVIAARLASACSPNYRLDRAPAIESDLVALCGAHWSHDIPLLAAGDLYARRIAKAAEGDGTRLIAHAYTRYLGDLSGGQILQRLLARSLELQPVGTVVLRFSAIFRSRRAQGGLSPGARSAPEPWRPTRRR